MQITNMDKIEKQILYTGSTTKRILAGLQNIVKDIINEELPKGEASSIASKLYAIQLSPKHYRIVSESRVWFYLNWGTGIYNPVHAGQGPGGMIIPITTKALHFKNSEIAAALGFETEDVFLKKVKGIPPRYFFEVQLETSKLQTAIAKSL